MSHNLEVAIDIADAVSNASINRLPLDVRCKAAELASRHHVPGLSSEEIAAALKDESDAAGVATE